MSLQCPVCYSSEGSDLWVTTKCGHIFHKHCIEQSIEYCPSTGCPTCRKKVGGNAALIRIYPLIEDLAPTDASSIDGIDLSELPSDLQERVSERIKALNQQVTSRSKQYEHLAIAHEELKKEIEQLNATSKASQRKNKDLETRLQDNIDKVNVFASRNQKLQDENKTLKAKLEVAEGAAARIQLAFNHQLQGSELRQQLETLAKTTNLPVPDYLMKALETRNSALTVANKRGDAALRAKAVVEEEVRKLSRRIESLETELEDLKEHIGGSVGASNQTATKRALDNLRNAAADAVAAMAAPPAKRPARGGAFRSGAAATLQRRDVFGSDELYDGPLWPEDNLQGVSFANVPKPAPPQAPLSNPVHPPSAAAPRKTSCTEQQRALVQRTSKRLEVKEDKIPLAETTPAFQWQPPPSVKAPPIVPETNELQDIVLENEDDDILEIIDEEEEDDIELVDEDEAENRPLETIYTNANGLKGGFLTSAGPSKLGLQFAPGASFIKRTELASTGLNVEGHYLHKGPDGRGGVVSVYRSSGLSSGSGAAPKRQNPGADRASTVNGKKAKIAAKAAGTSDTLTIAHFFNKHPKS